MAGEMAVSRQGKTGSTASMVYTEGSRVVNVEGESTGVQKSQSHCMAPLILLNQHIAKAWNMSHFTTLRPRNRMWGDYLGRLEVECCTLKPR